MYVNVHSPMRNIIVDKIVCRDKKYTVLDEQRHEAKEVKSQRKNHRSITRGTYNMLAVNASTVLALRSVFSKVNKHTTDQDISLKFSH